MGESKLIITADEAENLLLDGEYVHNFAQPASGVFFGCDYARADAIKAFRNAELIEIGGPGCKAMKHPIVVWDKPNHFTFFEADTEKVEALERARNGSAS